MSLDLTLSNSSSSVSTDPCGDDSPLPLDFMGSLLQSLDFTPQSFQHPTAWVGHLPFAAWLVQQTRPQQIVELGTHSGNSYFTLCQSVKSCGLNTRCCAIDTWQGDEHAGSYAADVYKAVEQHNQTHYASFSTLMRSTFDDAVHHFAPGSIDLLHIDGLHTYEAVRHDFESWRPKLTATAMVMFHDTRVYDRGFGVWKLWAELCQQYPFHLEFLHSNGLGILALDQQDGLAWLCPGSRQHTAVIDVFTSLGMHQVNRARISELRTHADELHIQLEHSVSAQEKIRTELHETHLLAQRLQGQVQDKTHHAAALEQHLSEQQQKLQIICRERDEQVKQRTQYEEHNTVLQQQLAQQQAQVHSLEQQCHSLEQHKQALAITVEQMRASHSWRMTAVLRSVSRLMRFAWRSVVLTRQMVHRHGSLMAVAKRLQAIQRSEGRAGLVRRLQAMVQGPICLQQPALDSVAATVSSPAGDLPSSQTWHCVPRYLTEDAPVDLPASFNPSIAIHLHLYYPDMLQAFTARFSAIPRPFDLYVSVPHNTDVAYVRQRIRDSLPQVTQIIVEMVPNRGRDVAPLIVQFGQRLQGYDIIAHVHSKKSPHNVQLTRWCTDILNLLFGDEQSNGAVITQILQLLHGDAKLIYPEGQTQILKDRSGWGANHDLAAEILHQHTALKIEDFPVVEFSEGSMFWARTHCLREFLSLPLTWKDFPAEPIPADGTLAHALERLLLVMAKSHPGQFYRLHRGDSIPEYRAYEEQEDFSASVCADIKVLSYYLPQFHPIPENDAWHGTGFTEWINVRKANPLFEGHYQQHIPHADIGYYLLDSPEPLRRQAQQMRQGGVHGQIFYHYWFTGTLILEQPAQILLAHPDIAMPFCFCWANENWTRRWDGNDDDVLLQQTYSAEDARAFIRYLLPFFHDSRYLRVDNRPLLYVYRPDSMPDPAAYLSIWAEECAASDLSAPYVVAVLTRGATDPRLYGMDAGVERVLHDWTDGAVADIRHQLRAYEPLEGSVLDYDAVADFYRHQQQGRDYPWFRSIIPNWDNTARYGGKAMLVHGSTPASFARWLQDLVHITRRTLPEDRRFIVVNAWNEWAEGAHLEPDTRYGYAYLNAIGRVLSAESVSGASSETLEFCTDLHLRIDLAAEVEDSLQQDERLRQRLCACLAQSSLWGKIQVSLGSAWLAAQMPEPASNHSADVGGTPDFVLQFRRPALVGVHSLEALMQRALSAPGAVVLPQSCDGSTPLPEPDANGSVVPASAFEAPMLLFPVPPPACGYKNYRLCSEAMAFVTGGDVASERSLPQVSTVMRYHAGGNLQALERALYSLAAMRDCIVCPVLTVQDLSADQHRQLQALLARLPWPEGRAARVLTYATPTGQGDLRARMLHDGLQAVTTRYAGFLDYDDVLFPCAYSWLLQRLHSTGKAVSFGRVYSTSCHGETGLLSHRWREFTHGNSYADFWACNHAPLHSFLLDLSQLDLSGLEYVEGQRYLEDYYLTLQLFTPDNVDWNSLAQNVYIGDYLHQDGEGNTLAVVEGSERTAIIASDEYCASLQAVEALRSRLRDAKA